MDKDYYLKANDTKHIQKLQSTRGSGIDICLKQGLLSLRTQGGVDEDAREVPHSANRSGERYAVGTVSGLPTQLPFDRGKSKAHVNDTRRAVEDEQAGFFRKFFIRESFRQKIVLIGLEMFETCQ